jgi:hypothetical protein
MGKILLFIAFGLISFCGISKAQHNIFRASVVKVDITPDDDQMLLGYNARKSNGVHDRIYHRVVGLDDGTTQFFLVSTDLCELSPSMYDKVAAEAEKRLGIKPMNWWWTNTHTHSAPECGPGGLDEIFLGDRYKHEIDQKYTALVADRLIQGLKEAKEKLAPARLGVGWGYAKANINRRGVDTNGKASLGLNPDLPVDRRIGLIKLENSDGSLLALIANYPMHGTVLGPQNLKISGDAPGIVANYVEEKTGAPMLFINGALGNMAPIYSVYPSPEAGHLDQFKVLLGDKILDAYKSIGTTTDKVKLNASGITVETPRKPMPWSEDLAAYTRTTMSGVNMVELPVRFLKINDNIAIWSAPLELFCEISNNIRDHSPFPFTFYYGVSNGWLGYMLPADQFKFGGYEPEVSPYTPAAAQDLTESVITYLQGEMNKTGTGN